MKITFDTRNAAEVAEVKNFLAEPVAAEKSTAGISTTPEDRQDPTQTGGGMPTQTTPEELGVDSLGMEWDGAIHAATKTKKADGSWKMAQGKKTEYEAAITAHKAAVAEANKPAGMPTMPDPVQETEVPADPISYEQLSTRFVGMMNSGQITDHSAVYGRAGVSNPSDLTTNESLRVKLWSVMDEIEQG